jgi:glutaconyl-CoA/methylmalonyl-CoA decarboxylase subunit delta
VLEIIIERIGYGLGVTVFSMSFVFIVLVMLMFVLKLQGFIFRDRPNKILGDEKKNDVITEIKDLQVEVVEKNYASEEEIAAAIVAAICTYSNVSSDEFIIKSIRRVSGNDSNWRKAGVV